MVQEIEFPSKGLKPTSVLVVPRCTPIKLRGTMVPPHRRDGQVVCVLYSSSQSRVRIQQTQSVDVESQRTWLYTCHIA